MTVKVSNSASRGKHTEGGSVGYSACMKHDPATVRGSRDELTEELKKAREGWLHFGKPLLADQAGLGVSRLESGESSARVGHVTYIVTD